MSPFFTGPFTLRISDRFGLCTNATFTCVIPPLDPAGSEHGEHDNGEQQRVTYQFFR